MASRPWAGARLSRGSIQVGRCSVPYLALLAGIRIVATVYKLSGVGPTIAVGDMAFYFNVVKLSDQGFYPFLHFWMEYPPVFPMLVTGLYRLLALIGATSPQEFARAFTIALLLVELGNLALVYVLVRRAYGEKAARWAAAIYAGCPILIWISGGWFDPLAVLFSLAAVYALTTRRATTAGILIGLGILTKVFPGALIVAAPAALGWRGTRRLVIASGATMALLLAPFVLIRPDLLVASFASMVTRGPWETLAAVASGYYAWGDQPLLENRFTAASAFFTQPQSAASAVALVIQGVLVLSVVGGWIAWRFGRASARDVHTVAALGVVTFALGNKGFSPQFVVWLIPVVLLAWPNRVGLAYIVLLSCHTWAYLQWVHPAMKGYYVEGVGSLEHVAMLVTLSVVVRTILIGAIAAHMLVLVARDRLPVPSWPRFAFLGITHTQGAAVK